MKFGIVKRKFNRGLFSMRTNSSLAVSLQRELSPPIFSITSYQNEQLSINNSIKLHNFERRTVRKEKGYWKSLDNQKEFLEKFLYNNNLKNEKDLLQITSIDIVREGGGGLLNFYHGKLQNLLKTLYPHIVMEDNSNITENSQFSHSISTKHGKKLGIYSSIEKQREYLKSIAEMNNFRSITELKTLKISQLKKYKIANRILNHYNDNYHLLLISLFPDENWKFKKEKGYWNSIPSQLIFLENLFNKWEMKTLDDWLKISIASFRKEGGDTILKLYSSSMFKMLKGVYPNYDWSDFPYRIRIFSELSSSLSLQKNYMSFLFAKLKLKSIDEWRNIKRKMFKEIGGSRLLKIYHYNFQLLLKTIYHDYDWNFIDKKRKKIIYLIKKYQIERKKDWYRIPSSIFRKIGGYFPFLSTSFPTEKWAKSQSSSRDKKSKQRSLFISLYSLFKQNNFQIIENYRHDFIISNLNYKMELDFFIPSLNMAIEYQGEQHYDDIPSGFSGIELYRQRDQRKLFCCNYLNINLIEIPYWWDLSPYSLLSTLLCKIKF